MAGDDEVSKQIDDFFSVKTVIIIGWVLFVPTLLSFIYGVTSWCLIKKFRNIRNYVLLSAISANAIRLFVFELCMILITPVAILRYPVLRVIPISLVMYTTLAFHCWLLVLSFYFYVDLVKVFHLEVRNRYLKCGLFAWGIPLILSIVYTIAALFCYVFNTTEIVTNYMFEALTKTLLLIPIMFNFMIYLTVVYSLFRGCEPVGCPAINKWCRFYIATLIFVLSNIIQLATILEILDIKVFAIVVIAELGIYLNTIALDVFIIIVKSNRELWHEFLKRRIIQNWQEM
ncbi:hypothetical protein PYW08_010720 [Mythimna loreyi]|uniref:Uncharacterized protein n=1 Tax=Mythimna loreyi TaxID=667449 RepID=A0ACC2Q3S0_9NEOP|nr:hypothetical protein PYW08_010720 [Mythimna loreyi]